jgi:transcriptional regulator with XRE-family HTH domain
MQLEISNHFRSRKVIMTDEARVLKDLRLAAGLGLREAARRWGRSHTLLAQLETGRLDVPKGERLDRLLEIYGVSSYKSFYDRVRNYKEKVTPQEHLLEIAEKLDAQKLNLLLTIAVRIAEGKAVLAF